MMTACRQRLAVLITHPVQYFQPLFAALARDPKLDLLVVYRDHARTKLDADGEVMHWLEALVRELQEQARLPDAGVADDDVPARTHGAALTLAGSPGEGGV